MAPSDPRFAGRLASDPRFIRPSKQSQKVVLDDRFKDLLGGSGDNAASNARVDKYGRRVGKNKEANDLKAFYRLDSAEGKGKGKAVVDRARGEGLEESSSKEDEEDESSDSEQDSDEEDEDDDAGDLLLGSKKARKAAAKKQRHREREGANSDSEEGLVDLDEDDDDAAGPSSTYPISADAQVESSIPTMEGSTKRIAIVNLDWDNVRSIDLYKVFDSVLSPSASGLLEGSSLGSRKSKSKIGKGRVVSVKIYPSQFGKERMEREEKEGPPVEIFSKNRKQTVSSSSKSKKTSKGKAQQEDDFSDLSDSDEEDEGNEYDEVALRRYQLERLRYYYAVVEFDTVQAAQHAYEEIEGTEFEATANVLDLRYVPDDTVFDDAPTDTATANSVEVQAYKPVEFVTDALRNSKVKLTWDADDPTRAKLLKSTHNALTAQKGKKASTSREAAVDYSALLASDSEDDAEAARRMRSAFGFAEDRGSSSDDEGADSAEEGLAMMNGNGMFGSRGSGKGEKGEMEITFGPALSGNADDENEEGEKDETSLDAYQRKERERRLARKEKRKAEKKRLANKEGKGRSLLLDEDGGSDPDEAFDANRFEAAGNDENGNDIFFAGDNSAEEAGAVDTEKKLSKKAARQLEREAKAKEAASLSLLVGGGENGSDDEEGGGDGKHFDMQAILRAEKISSKPKKVLKKGKDRKKHKEATELLEREKDKFEVDTKDDRFKRLHEDHEFALDPSNPRYMKTKNMERLLAESRKRRSDQAPVEAVASITSSANGSASANSSGLSSLVESIKRKSASSASNGAGDTGKKAKKQKKA